MLVAMEAANLPGTRIKRVSVSESLAWMRVDLLIRLLPFLVAVGAVELIWRPSWLGLSWGQFGTQLGFGLVAGAIGFVMGTRVRFALASRLGFLPLPGAHGAALQSGYFLLNAPIEEGFFRGLLQGGLSSVLGPFWGIGIATTAYVLYHRLGAWAWSEVFATALVGLPLALAFFLLPGPASLLGVSIAHAGATCGFLGPGPWLWKRLSAR